MSDHLQHFENMKRFVSFTDQDVANLVSLAPLFAEHAGEITDRFYKVLGDTPELAPLLEGRIDHLKATHHKWMNGLFAGEYGEQYLQDRFRIGRRHVEVGLNPAWVEGVMSMLRAEGLTLICKAIANADEAGAKAASFFKILDLDLYIINRSYASFAEERLLGLAAFTGMNRKLLENLMKRGMGSKPLPGP